MPEDTLVDGVSACTNPMINCAETTKRPSSGEKAAGGAPSGTRTPEPAGLNPHALRHTAASLAIAGGANVKVVQTMLGHQSATMTLDLYGHPLADQLDEVADAMDAAPAAGMARRAAASVAAFPDGRRVDSAS